MGTGGLCRQETAGEQRKKAKKTVKVKTVKLRSYENEIIEVEADVMRLSAVVDNVMATVQLDQDEVVDLSSMPASLLRKIVQFCQHDKDEPPAPAAARVLGTGPTADRPTDDLSAWDRNFLDVDQSVLFKLLIASKYLQIKRLNEACCKTIANMIKGRSAEELRVLFNIGHNGAGGQAVS